MVKPVSPELRQRRSEYMRALWASPEGQKRRAEMDTSHLQTLESREAQRASLKDTMKDPALREAMSRRSLAQWADPEYRARVPKPKPPKATPEFRRARSEALRKRWQDPEYRARMLAKVREWNARPESKEKKAKIMSANWKLPGFREAHKMAVGAMYERPGFRQAKAKKLMELRRDPEFCEKHLAAVRAPENLKRLRKQAADLKGRWKDEEYRRQMSDARGGFHDMPEPAPERHPDHVDIDPYVEASQGDRDRAATIAREYGIRIVRARDVLLLMEDEGLDIESAIEAVQSI